MHNWAIVNRFTAQNFIILQLRSMNFACLISALSAKFLFLTYGKEKRIYRPEDDYT